MKELEDYQRPADVADFAAEVGVDPALGLSRDEAMARRELYGANRVTPPVNCPSWICCLLPCLLRTASMQAYHAVLPREATVRRRTSPAAQKQGQPAMRRMRMDAMSLVYGDVVELKAGDVASADLRVVECSDDCVVDQSTLMDEDEDEELGQHTRKHLSTGAPSSHQMDALHCANIVPMTARVLQGTAVCVVVSTGDHTLWGRMLAQHEWPPVSTGPSKKEDQEKTSLIV